MIREGGTIGQVSIIWITVNDTDNDILENGGLIKFEDGQRDGEIQVKIRGDTIPELDEQYGIVLVNASKVLSYFICFVTVKYYFRYYKYLK